MKVRFVDLFRESVVLQGLLTIGLWGVASYMMVTGQDVPELLCAGCGAIITFWFKSKTDRAIAASRIP